MYDVNILVNGSRCKQYHHDGKIFIEAKDGSEYTIEIKNNAWKRILAVCSVDGLDILTGKKAIEGNPGYVINAQNSGKFDGFRVSNEKVAKFLFGAKGDSYAASKGDNSERNVGVIGVRLFEEKVKPAPTPTIIREEHHHHHHDYWWSRPYYGTPNTTPLPGTIWCDTTLSGGTRGVGASSGVYNCSNTMGDSSLGATFKNCSDETKYSCDSIPTKGAPSAAKYSAGAPQRKMGKAGGQSAIRACSANNVSEGVVASYSNNPLRGFDMGTQWGGAKESRVIEVEFERGILALSTNIYYASRQSLIEMGVPLGNEKQVSFPEAFADSKYAQPPKNWVG